jgi:hypothetical protein
LIFEKELEFPTLYRVSPFTKTSSAEPAVNLNLAISAFAVPRYGFETEPFLAIVIEPPA